MERFPLDIHLLPSMAVRGALVRDRRVLVLGGDCTVELGTVAGALRHDRNVGLLYMMRQLGGARRR